MEERGKGTPRQPYYQDDRLSELAAGVTFGVDGPLDVEDAISLEVTVVDGRELYSFPDSPRFEEIPLATMIGHGTVATGVYAGHIKSIFTDGAAKIDYVGDETVDGQSARRFDYAVSPPYSRYSLTRQGVTRRVPYYGSFWTAVDSDQLVRLTVRADTIPPELGVTGFATQIDYETLDLESGSLLAPRRSGFSMLLSTGVESVIHTRIDDCRAFVGSSVLSFDKSSARFYLEKTDVVANLRLPPGVRLPVRLTSQIDSEESRVGSSVEAVLTSDVRLETGLVLPKGAVLRGRLRRFDYHGGDQSYYGVGIEFQELMFGDSRAIVSLALDEVGANVLGVQKQEPIPRVAEALEGGVVTDMRNAVGLVQPNTADETAERPVVRGLFGVGVFYVYTGRTDRLRIPPGLQMSWRTISRDQP